MTPIVSNVVRSSQRVGLSHGPIEHLRSAGGLAELLLEVM